MTIETKYNIGQEVWGIVNGGAHKLKIRSIVPHYSKEYKVIKYGFGKTPYTGYFDLIEESKLYPTKEELLKSL